MMEKKTITDSGTSKHTAKALERPSSEVSDKGCPEFSQAFA